MNNKFKNNIIITILLSMALFFISHTNEVLNLITSNINIFIYNIFPSLFFFFMITDLLLEFNFINILNKLFHPLFKKIFRISKNSSFIFVMSLLSGFPSGSKYIKNLLDKKMINDESANNLIVYTHYSNIAFILGTVGIILNDRKLTIIVLLCHFLSNFILAFLIRNKNYHEEIEKKHFRNISFSESFAYSVINNIKTLLIIFSTMIFFSTIAYMIISTIPLNTYLKAFISGILDLSSGTMYLRNLSIPIFNKALLIIIFLSFGSITVHLQVRVILNKTKVKYSNYLLGRISQVGIATLLYLLIYRYFY